MRQIARISLGGSVKGKRTKLFSLCVLGFFLASPLSSFGQNPSSADAHTYLVRGMAAVEMAKSNDGLADAVKEFRKATEIDPNMAAAWYNMGTAQTKMEKLHDAVESYKRYLTLVPLAEDAQKVKDQIIKLEYKLERMDRLHSLSGQWLTSDGRSAYVIEDGGKIQIRFAKNLHFPGSADVWVRNVLNKPPTTYEFGAATLTLSLSGKSLSGSFEFSDNSHSDGRCVRPGERNPVKGTLHDGSMNLKFKKGKYKVILDYETDTSELFKIKTRWICNQIVPIGSLSEDLILFGPLGNGGLGVVIEKQANGPILVKKGSKEIGVEDGDEIISIDGVKVASLGLGEVIMKLRGELGSAVELALKRTIVEGGGSSKQEDEGLKISVRRRAIKSAK